ncbi:MAG: hypothetical protein ABFS18_03390 [Thermodesulfobacteriota bacterium]
MFDGDGAWGKVPPPATERAIKATFLLVSKKQESIAGHLPRPSTEIKWEMAPARTKKTPYSMGMAKPVQFIDNREDNTDRGGSAGLNHRHHSFLKN